MTPRPRGTRYASSRRSGGDAAVRSAGSRQRQDRDWSELLQELRGVQTGIHLLTGFLLTLPFQPRFATLTPTQLGIYLTLQVLSVLVMAVLLSAFVMHRSYFRYQIRYRLLRNADLVFRWTLVLMGMILMGTLGLVFDLVMGGLAGAVAAAGTLLVLLTLWIVLPTRTRRKALRTRQARTQSGGRGTAGSGRT